MEPSDWLIPTSDADAAAHLPEPSLLEPFPVALLFLRALHDPTEYRNALERLVTPESLPSWGDFSEPATALDRVGSWGVGSVADHDPLNSDVAYVKVLGDVDQSYQARADLLVDSVAIITLARRPSLGGRWFVHAYGLPAHPDDVPTT